MEMTVKFAHTRETKNAHVFSEVNEKGKVLETADAIVGTIYLKKSVVGETAPDGIEISIKTVGKIKSAKNAKTVEKKTAVKKVAVKKAA